MPSRRAATRHVAGEAGNGVDLGAHGQERGCAVHQGRIDVIAPAGGSPTSRCSTCLRRRCSLPVRTSGEEETRVQWLREDLLEWQPSRQYGLCHDRALFHFLVESQQRERYRSVLPSALSLGGLVIIATFAPGGPERYSVSRSPGTAPRASSTLTMDQCSVREGTRLAWRSKNGASYKALLPRAVVCEPPRSGCQRTVHSIWHRFGRPWNRRPPPAPGPVTTCPVIGRGENTKDRR